MSSSSIGYKLVKTYDAVVHPQKFFSMNGGGIFNKTNQIQEDSRRTSFGMDNKRTQLATYGANALLMLAAVPAILNLLGIIHSNVLAYTTVGLAGGSIAINMLSLQWNRKRAFFFSAMTALALSLGALGGLHLAGKLSNEVLRYGSLAIAGIVATKVALYFSTLACGDPNKIYDIRKRSFSRVEENEDGGGDSSAVGGRHTDGEAEVDS